LNSKILVIFTPLIFITIYLPVASADTQFQLFNIIDRQEISTSSATSINEIFYQYDISDISSSAKIFNSTYFILGDGSGGFISGTVSVKYQFDNGTDGQTIFSYPSCSIPMPDVTINSTIAITDLVRQNQNNASFQHFGPCSINDGDGFADDISGINITYGLAFNPNFTTADSVQVGGNNVKFSVDWFSADNAVVETDAVTGTLQNFSMSQINGSFEVTLQINNCDSTWRSYAINNVNNSNSTSFLPINCTITSVTWFNNTFSVFVNNSYSSLVFKIPLINSSSINSTIVRADQIFEQGISLTNKYLQLSGGTLNGILISQIIRPSSNQLYDLGTSDFRWAKIWTNNIDISGTVNGSIATLTGNVTGSAFSGNLDCGRITGGSDSNYCIDTDTTIPSSRVTFWKATSTTAVTNQGSNLPAALTEIDAAVQGTRLLIDPSDIGDNVKCSVNARVVNSGAGLTINVSLRDASNTSNVLCWTTFSGTTTGTNLVSSTYSSKPSWFISAMNLTSYSQSGNGAADFIFKDISLIHRN